jgi:hypothetical protein
LTRLGLLSTRGHALETLAHATDFVFDKTGTLTTGQFSLLDMEVLRSDRANVLALAQALEQGRRIRWRRLCAKRRRPAAIGGGQSDLYSRARRQRSDWRPDLSLGRAGIHRLGTLTGSIRGSAFRWSAWPMTRVFWPGLRWAMLPGCRRIS